MLCQDPKGSLWDGSALFKGTILTGGQMMAWRVLGELRSWTSYTAELSSNLETFSYPKKISPFKRLEAIQEKDFFLKVVFFLDKGMVL